MIELRFANDEEGVMDYLVEWGEISRNNRSFYHYMLMVLKRMIPYMYAICLIKHIVLVHAMSVVLVGINRGQYRLLMVLC